MNKIIVTTLGCLLLTGTFVTAQHVMPPGMSHEEHLRQLKKEQALKERGLLAMGFDQDASEHHFLLFANGGAIVVVSKDPENRKLVGEIRSHLQEIAKAFAEGIFDKPVATHDELPPGAGVMRDQQKAIIYRYVEHPAGGRVVIETADLAVLKSVHDFLRYQITEHKTGDSLSVQ
ncbi:MAG TPA: hypothetical protein VF491_01950 [Vicinamibacterales bacterium]|jgi:hypothetical protein